MKTKERLGECEADGGSGERESDGRDVTDGVPVGERVTLGVGLGEAVEP